MSNPVVDTTDAVCPVCARRGGDYSILVGSYRVLKCADCGLEHTLPVPTNDELERFYSTYADIRANPEIVKLNAKRNYECLTRYGINQSSYILDFGCGNGEFVEISGNRCFGIELSGRKHGGRVFDDLSKLPIDRFDCITLWGVLEHLNNVVPTIEDLKQRLKTGGYLAITTVDAEGPIPYYFKPPEHLTYWTRKAFSRLLEDRGFQIESVNPYEMCQLSEVYLDRLLSRTPKEYAQKLLTTHKQLPRIVTVPTNEVLVIATLQASD